MMILGEYTFSLATAAYQSFERSKAYRWAAQKRVGREAAMQFLGPGEETVSLPGTVYPHAFGSARQIASMRAQADKGEPLLLVDGLGNVLGFWVVLSVKETHSALFKDGVARRVDFDLKLRYYGEIV